jgi:prepilin-type N-terminal cleavage/methylation domain-containing protein
MRSSRRGLSLAELLVVVAIIGIVVAIVVPVASGARRSAARAREAAALRSVLFSWISYATDQGGHLLPGYRSGYDIRDANGQPVPPADYGNDAEVRKRYPWRLAPWLDQDFLRLFVGDNAGVLERLRSGDRSRYYYFASLYPSFGLNSAFVGGDEARFPSDPLLPNGAANPFARYSVSRFSVARRPARTIAFASARTSATEDGSINEGYFRIDAPWLNSPAPRWGTAYLPGDPLSCGSLSARGWGDEIATGTMDGTVEFAQVDTLRDMTRWCDAAPEREWWIGKP